MESSEGLKANVADTIRKHLDDLGDRLTKELTEKLTERRLSCVLIQSIEDVA